MFAILLLTFGVTILSFALGNPNWYKKMWEKNINDTAPDNLINVTVILGAVCTGLGFIFGLVCIIKSEGETRKYSRIRKKKKQKGIILIERKLKTGPSGGSYYVRRKCDRHGCKIIKVYTK